MTKPVSIGRLLRSSTRGCAVGCLGGDQTLPAFGSLVRVPANPDVTIYGIIYDTRVDDDGLVRQLAGNTALSDEVIEDNRRNRNTPVEISVLFLGYEQHGEIVYLLPPQPPLSLVEFFPCSQEETRRFCSGRPAYLRFLASALEIPAADLAAALFCRQAAAWKPDWQDNAIREWISR